jgi:peptidoglycan pentaglycine glycine transferase (the first glycine)
MEVREIKDKIKYNSFVKSQKHSQFLQSWEWGEFQVSDNFSVLRLGLYDGDRLRFAATLIKKKLPIGKVYYYCPRVEIKNLSKENLELFLEEIKRRSKKENIIFLRFEPVQELRIKNKELRIKKTFDVQPSKTMILDLLKTEDELLSAMHSKTRYNIRLAKRKGVKVSEVSFERFEEFWDIMKETGGRDGFRLHSKEHYKKMLGISSEAIKIKLFFAEYDNEVITANIVCYFGDMVTYVHGASSNKYRNVMAPYLLQWHIIKQAKKQGHSSYDFHGVGEGSLAGVTRFKKGFSGEIVEYPGVFDIIFDKGFYAMYQVLRKVRRMV